MNPTHALICQLAWMVISVGLALLAAWVMLRPPGQPSAKSESEYDTCEVCGSDHSVAHNPILHHWYCPQCHSRLNTTQSAIICRACGRHVDGQREHAQRIRPTLCTQCAFDAERDALQSLESL